jgi:stress-induced morphogen
MIRRTITTLAAAAAGPSLADVENKLKVSSLKPTALKIEDISGGCGSFYRVTVTSKAFEGKSLVQQHRLVNEALKEEIAQMHGITVITKTP